MTLRWLFTAMWNALYVLYNERPDDEELEFWVDDGDPYIWAGRYSKVQSIQEKFEEYVCKHGKLRDDYDKQESHEIVSAYIHDETAWGDRFDDITLEEWSKLYDLIQDDEDNYLPFNVSSAGKWANSKKIPASIKGRTLKSIEYVKVDGGPKGQERTAHQPGTRGSGLYLSYRPRALG